MTNPCNLQHPERLYIDGDWIAPAQPGSLYITSPHLGSITASTAAAGREDADRAVAAARKAFDHGDWPLLPPSERAEYLRRLHAELEKRADDIANAAVIQTGTPAGAAAMMAGLGGIILDYFANGAPGFEFEKQLTASDGGNALILRTPVGVVAAIAPWNAPYSIMMNKIAPALLAGCSVIMKPAPETPLEAYIIAECADAAGFPPGVLNLIPAERAVSDHLVCSSGVDKVSFTGSTVAGKRIAAVCGERIARCALELGGKSAAIVLDDFDVAAAAGMLGNIITMGCGQVCVTLSRVLVPRDKHDAMVAALKSVMTAVKVGDPTDPQTQMGPLAMFRQLERVESYIEIGKKEGATLVCGGDRPEGLSGCYINPTLFANVDNSMRIAQEEIFGPVLCVIPYDSVDDAIRIANDSDYGLFGAVLTHDNALAYKVARRVRSGAFAQNGFRLDYFLPFGGMKQSGIGREGGISGMESFTETRTLLMDAAPSSGD